MLSIVPAVWMVVRKAELVETFVFAIEKNVSN